MFGYSLTKGRDAAQAVGTGLNHMSLHVEIDPEVILGAGFPLSFVIPPVLHAEMCDTCVSASDLTLRCAQ